MAAYGACHVLFGCYIVCRSRSWLQSVPAGRVSAAAPTDARGRLRRDLSARSGAHLPRGDVPTFQNRKAYTIVSLVTSVECIPLRLQIDGVGIASPKEDQVKHRFRGDKKSPQPPLSLSLLPPPPLIDWDSLQTGLLLRCAQMPSRTALSVQSRTYN